MIMCRAAIKFQKPDLYIQVFCQHLHLEMQLDSNSSMSTCQTNFWLSFTHLLLTQSSQCQDTAIIQAKKPRKSSFLPSILFLRPHTQLISKISSFFLQNNPYTDHFSLSPVFVLWSKPLLSLDWIISLVHWYELNCLPKKAKLRF